MRAHAVREPRVPLDSGQGPEADSAFERVLKVDAIDGQPLAAMAEVEATREEPLAVEAGALRTSLETLALVGVNFGYALRNQR